MPLPCPLLPRCRARGRLFVLVLILLAVLLAGCPDEGKKPPQQRARPAMPVTTAKSRLATVPVEHTATAHIESPQAVAVRSRVTGALEQVHFVEGREVKAGDRLFTIDPRPFAAVLAKAEAELARDRAELANSRRDVARYAKAAQQGFVSAEQADQAATRVATLTAAVQAGEAAVAAARLELDFCSIRAPVAGRTGEVTVDAGNLVRANDELPLVTIRQLSPVDASFTLPGHLLAEIRRHQAEGALPVFIPDPAGGDAPVGGRLHFIDNTVDPATGVIRLKASFQNDDQRLWPGQMVDVRLRVSERPDAVVVPAQAVQNGQQGPYVYVVNAKEQSTVAFRPVTPGLLVGDEVVIDHGLAAGERVVIDGQLQLADGVTVQERAAAPAKTGAATAGQTVPGKP